MERKEIEFVQMIQFNEVLERLHVPAHLINGTLRKDRKKDEQKTENAIDAKTNLIYMNNAIAGKKHSSPRK